MTSATASAIDWSDSPAFGRRISLTHSLEILKARRENPAIVEFGTSYAYSPDGLGNALLAFAWYAGNFGARVLSVDVQPGGLEVSQRILREHAPAHAHQAELVMADCFDWASERREPIDFLYMDAGMELICDLSFQAYARRFADRIPSFYLELYKRFALECFPPGSLMLFDDSQPVGDYWGKGYFIVPHLLKEGSWRQIDMRGEPVFPMVLLERM